jgi:uncharacterized protein
MKLLRYLLLMLICSAATLVLGQDIPNPVGRLNDFAGQCSAAQAVELDALLKNIEANTTSEVAVTTVATCNGDPSGYRLAMFNQWGIGKDDTDNGLLIVHCTEERTLAQETGYGMEGTLPDLLTAKMSQDNFIPEAREGRYCQGIINLVRAYSPLIGADPSLVSQATPENSDQLGNVALVSLMVVVCVGSCIMLFFAFWLMSASSRGSSIRRSSSSSGSWSTSDSGFNSWSSSGSSDSGDSSSSSADFGGGDSGGGGSNTTY